MTKLERLEKLARNATPGPWTIVEAATSDQANHIWSIASPVPEIDRMDTVLCSVKTDETGDSHCVSVARADAEFIAAASPDVVLELIARIRELEADIYERDQVAMERS